MPVHHRWFLSAAEDIDLLPAVNRLRVRFRDDQGRVRGLTSVAVWATIEPQ